jgi:ribosomal-protein-alanine N-acetyltransferase
MRNTPLRNAAIANLETRWIEPAAALERLAGDVGWTKAHFEKELSLAMSRFYVVARDAELLGYGGFWKIEEEAQITNLVIAPSERRQGLGQRLLGFLLERAAVEGCTRCRLEVRDNNDAALRLYKKAGFERVGFRPGAYERPFGDAILMEKLL